ncbi:protein kinase domain-containing protein [Haematococcus lacustris]|uniref:Protein kinase domain-containing protein n=1 Tax=Haematococcus lacustris TaxID=44745 RepID=A0A699ZU49_HAELA|nr:protein kinase domain-containing protein [Haematococcus lacustris]
MLKVLVIAKAGQGAFGSVYVAMWRGILVAVKVMKQQMDGRRAMRTAWELAVTKSLQHSNVVAVLNVLTDVLVEKHSKRVIRFVPSTAVDAAITSWSSSMGVPTLSAAIGMDKESQPRCQGFIHCDLKPENILLKVAPGDNRGFTAKVSDFGLSDLSTSEGLLMGELGGTVTHLDPCIVTQRKVSKKSDVYSFGICMWELYTGQRPYIELLQSSKDKRSRDKLILSKVSRLIPRL